MKTLTLLCTLMLGAMAIWQTIASIRLRQLLIRTVACHRQTIEVLEGSQRMIQVLAACLPSHREAAQRGDASACGAILGEAVKKINTIAAEFQPADVTDEHSTGQA